MKKVPTHYVCQNCGINSVKWHGKCPSCNNWNSLIEEIIEKSSQANIKKISNNKIISLNKVESLKNTRIDCQNSELNRVLGGGLVKGSLILIGGDPGVGKSTLMLQLAINLEKERILYISGEESNHQIKLRAKRLEKNQLSNNCFLFNETNLEIIIKETLKFEPSILIIDSIQTLYSETLESSIGSISQVRYCTSILMSLAKTKNIAIFLIGHITKEGMIAGPKVLEHMVDTVLQFEGDRHIAYRILRTTKNRFGSTSELGIFEMYNDGLKIVKNPSEIFLSQQNNNLNGRAIGIFIEGNRALLVEIQSLVSKAIYGNPQRSSTGFDLKRLNMLLAVLEKKSNFNMLPKDVFLNITGGLKIEDPALDLAVCISIISSYLEQEIPLNICFAAEIGLSGEIRAVNRIEKRILEAEKLGFEKIYLSKYSLKSLNSKTYKIKIKAFETLNEILDNLNLIRKKILN